MLISLLQSKLHRIRVTRSELHYVGSCSIDEDLLESAGIRELQHIEIYNVDNGERFTTYALKAPRGSGEVCPNGASARKVAVGDRLIICTYSQFSEAEAEKHKPKVVMVDDQNRALRETRHPAVASVAG
jgi:aspartate 1-decarboxylase